MPRTAKKANFQVVWSGVETSSPSLVLHSGTKSYVFNCGEGLQRVLSQKNIKLTNMDSFYLTRHQWSHIGGLFGLGISLRNRSREQVSDCKRDGNLIMATKKISHIPVNSTPGMAHILSSSKSWLKYHDEGTDSELKVHHSSIRQDEQLKIQAVLIHSKANHSPITLLPESHTDSSPNSADKNTNEHIIETISTFDMGPKSSFPAVCYVCHFNPLAGKFDSVQAEKLGIPRGPLRGELVRGNAVILPDGRTIQPSDVVSASIPGPICLIVDCPSVSYIENLTKSGDLELYFSGPNAAHMVFHFTPQGVCEDPAYVAWMNNFSVNARHIFLDGLQQKTLPFESQHSLQIMLNRLDSKFFPLIDSAKCTSESDSSVKNFTKFFVRESFSDPSKGIDEGDTFPVIAKEKITNIVNKALSIHSAEKSAIGNGTQTLSEEGHDSIPSPKRTRIDSVENSLRKYPLTVCLGTASSSPSKYRNVSGTLIFLNEDTAVLLDCGEGTYCEMVRHYGDSVNSVLRKVCFIFISHMYPDHHLGLITLVSKLNEVREDNTDLPLIMMPHPMALWLRSYAQTSERLKFRYCWCNHAYDGVNLTDTIEVRSVKVQHPAFAHGLVITCSDGLKITFSGDTMPCDSLIAAGMNSTLLIHEATLADGMEEDALRKKHSTTSQAVDVARRMQAEWLLLTHISQRYPKVPIMETNELSSRTVYAFDHMEIMLDDIPRFSGIVPKLKILNDLI